MALWPGVGAIRSNLHPGVLFFVAMGTCKLKLQIGATRGHPGRVFMDDGYKIPAQLAPHQVSEFPKETAYLAVFIERPRADISARRQVIYTSDRDRGVTSSWERICAPSKKTPSTAPSLRCRACSTSAGCGEFPLCGPCWFADARTHLLNVVC